MTLNSSHQSSQSKGFLWAGGIEDTFIPQERPGLRAATPMVDRYREYIQGESTEHTI